MPREKGIEDNKSFTTENKSSLQNAVSIHTQHSHIFETTISNINPNSISPLDVIHYYVFTFMLYNILIWIGFWLTFKWCFFFLADIFRKCLEQILREFSHTMWRMNMLVKYETENFETISIIKTIFVLSTYVTDIM